MLGFLFEDHQANDRDNDPKKYQTSYTSERNAKVSPKSIVIFFFIFDCHLIEKKSQVQTWGFRLTLYVLKSTLS